MYNSTYSSEWNHSLGQLLTNAGSVLIGPHSTGLTVPQHCSGVGSVEVIPSWTLKVTPRVKPHILLDAFRRTHLAEGYWIELGAFNSCHKRRKNTSVRAQSIQQCMSPAYKACCTAHVIGLPQGLTPRSTRGILYVREYKGMEWVLCPWAGGNSRDCFRINELEWGNSQHCWIMVGNHGDIIGIFIICMEGENAARPCYLKKSGVHSIMKYRDLVIFQSWAQFFTALSLGLIFSNKVLWCFHSPPPIITLNWVGSTPGASRRHVHKLEVQSKKFQPGNCQQWATFL